MRLSGEFDMDMHVCDCVLTMSVRIGLPPKFDLKCPSHMGANCKILEPAGIEGNNEFKSDEF